MPRIAVTCFAVVALMTPAPPSDAEQQVSYPAYHTVAKGESLHGIANNFLRRATGKSPSDRAVRNEMRQIKVLNRKTLHGSDQVQSGQRLELAPSQGDLPDGKPGWSTGFVWCKNERAPAGHSAPAAGLTFRVHLPKPPISRKEQTIRLSFHNASDRTQSFETQTEHGLLVSDSHPASAVMFSDGIRVDDWMLAPGETRRLDASVAAFVCGDTRYLNHRLPAGRYTLYGSTPWTTSKAQGRWVTEPVAVSVVR